MRLKDAIKQNGGTVSDLFNLPLSMMRPNPDNIRLDTDELRAHIRGIADSIKATGYLRSRPFTVRLVNDVAEIVDGNCRFAACHIAVAEGSEILTIPCVPEAVGTTEAERCANQLVANSGLAHSPIEMTVAIKRLLSWGWSDTAIASRIGKSRQYITNLLSLAGSAPEVREAVANGTVSATQAIKLIRSEGDKAGEAIAKAVKASGKARVTAKAFEAPKTVRKPVPIGQMVHAAQEVLRIWDSGEVGPEFDAAIRALRESVA